MAECSSEELVRARTDPSTFACLSRGEAIGLTVIVEAGLLSLLAILIVFLITMRNVRWRIKHLVTARFRIFHQPLDILIASLFVADIVQAVGAVLSLKWIQSGKVEVGTFCTVQGIVKILGATGVAFSTLSIAAYTFLEVFWFRTITSMKITLAIVVAFWSFITALVVGAMMQHRNESFSSMSPYYYWCWLNRHKLGYGWQLAVEYLWMWITLVFTFLTYVPLYLLLRGNLDINDRVWWRFSFTLHPTPIRRNSSSSLVMLTYPTVYSISVLPLSAAIWTATTQGHEKVPSALTFAAVSLFGLSGFFNAILLLKTRPASGIFGDLMLRRPVRPPSPPEQPGASSSHGRRDDGDVAVEPVEPLEQISEVGRR